MKRKSAQKKRSQPVRRTNAERSADTRSKLIQAAIDILFAKGYAATTTIEVTKRAKASRGAMLHHFPTRVDLLIATAEHILGSQRDYRREKLSAYAEDWSRFAAATEVTWELQQQPATVALLEIMLGSRSDRELRKRVAPLTRQIAALRAEHATSLAKALAVEDAQALDDLILIHDASLRGLTINLMFAQEPAQVEAARALLEHYEHTFARGLIAKRAAGR